MKYQIDKEDLKKINKWKKEQELKDKSNFVSGERWSYIFTPGSLGNMIGVRDNILNEEKDFTNYDYWA